MRFCSTFLGVLFIVCTSACAQNEAKNWFFGYHYGVTFDPSARSIGGGGTETSHENTVSFSDKKTGRLLFYAASAFIATDRFHEVTVYNASHLPMKGGENIRGNESSAYGMLVVPFPDNPQRYYLFSVDTYQENADRHGLWYSVIDMSADSGLGEVILRNVLVPDLPALAESITGTLQCNGHDFWIIVNALNSPLAIAIPITDKGVESYKITISPLPPESRNLTQWEKGVMLTKLSPDGKKFAIMNRFTNQPYSDLWMCDFDVLTGKVSNVRPMSDPSFQHTYGLSFSPDSRKLYTAQRPYIVQYDIMDNSQLGYYRSMIYSPIDVWDVRLGPDKKIYVYGAAKDLRVLGTILYPNYLGSECTLIPKTLFLGEQISTQGTGLYALPNYMDYIFDEKTPAGGVTCIPPAAKALPDSGCVGSKLFFSDLTPAFGRLFDRHWLFTGGKPEVSGDSMVAVIYSAPGRYPVRLVIANEFGHDTTYTEAVVYALPDVRGYGDTALCHGGGVRLYAEGADVYEWSPEEGLDAPWSPTPVASPTVTTRYVVRGRSAKHNCIGYDTVTVAVGEIIATASPDTAICAGGSVRLQAAGGRQYQWFPPDGLDDPHSPNPVARPAQTTTYRVEVRSDVCIGVDSVTITVLPSIVATAAPDTAICYGRSVGLWATGGQQYQWFPSDGLDNPYSPNPTATPPQTTTYRVEVRAGECAGMDSVTITVFPAVTASASPDTTICAGESVGLWATGGEQYQWFPPDGLDNPRSANPVARPAQTTIYHVITSNAGGCSDVDSVTITVLKSIAISVSPDTTFCFGGSVGLWATGGEQYLWSPPDGLDNPNSPTPTAAPSKTTTYRVTATKAGGCSGIDSVMITILPAVSAVASPDTVICFGESVRLWAMGGEQYLWNPADDLDNPLSANPVAHPSRTTTYHVTATNAGGCSDIDSVTIQVKSGALRRVAVFAPPQRVSPGSIADIRLSVGTGISGITGQLLYDGAALKLTGVPSATNGWNITTTETGYGVTDITAQGRATGADITLPMMVFLPPDARGTEQIKFNPVVVSTATCDTIETLSGEFSYSTTCAWALRSVIGNGKAYSVMVQGESVVYSIGLAGSVRVVLYDNLGRRIATLSDGYHAAGEYRVRLPEVAAGMYAARLETPLGAWSALVTKEW